MKHWYRWLAFRHDLWKITALLWLNPLRPTVPEPLWDPHVHKARVPLRAPPARLGAGSRRGAGSARGRFLQAGSEAVSCCGVTWAQYFPPGRCQQLSIAFQQPRWPGGAPGRRDGPVRARLPPPCPQILLLLFLPFLPSRAASPRDLPLSPQLPARPGLQPPAQPLTEGFFSSRPPRPTFLVGFGEFLAFHGVPFFFVVVVVERAVCKYRGNSTTEHFVVVLLSIKNTFCFSNKPHNQAF